LLKAYHYLITAPFTIAEIAYKVGFESPAYFNKCFKEAFGIPPGDIKRKGKILHSHGEAIFNFYQLPEIFSALNSSGINLSVQKDEKPPLKRPVKQWTAISLFVVIAIVTMAYYYESSKKFKGFSPDRNGRIAIVPFDNQTGDSLMTPVGDIASSWISGQLDDLDEVKIVPYFTIKEYLPYLGILPDDPNGRPTLGEVVHADYIITGSYFLRSGNLYVDSRLVDANSQELIYSMPVITGPKDSVMQILETLRLKIAGLLTNLEDVKIGKLNPPGYQAYVHYLQGLAELKSGLYPKQARLHFENAVALEPDFVMPQLFLTWFYRGQKRDSVVTLLGKIKNATSYEKSVCSEVYYLLTRNYKESLNIILKVLKDYPQDYYFNLIAGHRAKSLFMPDLSIDVLSKLKDPLQKDVGMVWHYYKVWNFTESLTMLGKYTEAIEYLNSIPADYHNHAIPKLYMAAYVPLGKTQREIEELINRFCRNDAKWCAEYYTVAAYEFSLISATETANYFAAKAKTLMSSLPAKKSFDFDLIDVLYLAGDYKAAQSLLKQGLKKNPADLESEIYLAYIEASLGDTIAAEEIFSGIKQDTLIFWKRHEFEYQLDYLKARMFAISGKKQAALNLLKRSLIKGQFKHHWDFDHDIFLRNVFSDSAFQSMIKPKEYSSITGLP
ncbi:MAG TPA: helix-turn-helix domain-containing protein, partial [Chryseolinea sp.]|nr:helix-turn-helix domain-containing protein [Chryseolinea sp.]